MLRQIELENGKEKTRRVFEKLESHPNLSLKQMFDDDLKTLDRNRKFKNHLHMNEDIPKHKHYLRFLLKNHKKYRSLSLLFVN